MILRSLDPTLVKKPIKTSIMTSREQNYLPIGIEKNTTEKTSIFALPPPLTTKNNQELMNYSKSNFNNVLIIYLVRAGYYSLQGE